MPSLYIRRAWQFFHANAGWATPPGKASCALSLANAEARAQALSWQYDWVDDTEASCDDWRCDCQEGTLAGDHDYQGCILMDADGRALGSLWGIVDATPNYRRVVEAELASEALSELERAWGSPACPAAALA